MTLSDLKELSSKLKKQGLNHIYLTYPMPKNPTSYRIRTPFGLCEILSVGHSGRANITVSKKQLNNLIKKLEKELK